MAKRKPLVIGATIPIEAVQPGDTIDGALYVSGTGKVLGRTSSGDGAHEEINISDLPIADWSDPQDITASNLGIYSLTTSDAGKMLVLTSGSAVSVEIPTNANQAFPVGTHIDVIQQGSGEVTFTPLSGVTLRSRNGTKLGGQYAGCTLFKRATDEWYLFGDLKV